MPTGYRKSKHMTNHDDNGYETGMVDWQTHGTLVPLVVGLCRVSHQPTATL